MERERKLRLADALMEEFNRLKTSVNFDVKSKKEDYQLAIEYLNTGEHPRHYNDFEMLYACIEDFEQLCNDYNV